MDLQMTMSEPYNNNPMGLTWTLGNNGDHQQSFHQFGKKSLSMDPSNAKVYQESVNESQKNVLESNGKSI